MNWKAQIATTANVLDRIAWLLLAIADLAERAATAPAARRRLVLAILRQAEATASDAFGGAHPANRHGASAEPIAASGDRPEHAMALAASLRLLALIVRALAAVQHRLSMMAGEGRHGGGLDRHRQFARRFANTARAQFLDTS